jgi:DNA-binding Lrp family transcriptional regulator
MARLEREGVITGYTVTLGEAYRAGQVAAHVLVEVEQRLTAQVTGQLGRISEVQALYAISGDYDLIVVLSAPSTGALSQLLDRISELRGVLRTKSSVILETKLQR